MLQTQKKFCNYPDEVKTELGKASSSGLFEKKNHPYLESVKTGYCRGGVDYAGGGVFYYWQKYVDQFFFKFWLIACGHYSRNSIGNRVALFRKFFSQVRNLQELKINLQVLTIL